MLNKAVLTQVRKYFYGLHKIKQIYPILSKKNNIRTYFIIKIYCETEKNEPENRLDLKAILNISYGLILMFKPMSFHMVGPQYLTHFLECSVRI